MANFAFTSGAARVDLTTEDPATLERREAANILIRDARRVRSRFHDGRFLTATDLTREQLYVLTRQADLSVARRGGIARGLEVRRRGAALHVTPGSGFTSNGELVTLPRALTVELADIPDDDRIDVSFGAVDVPEGDPRRRSGLYVLALRPLEYNSGRVTRYPLTVRGLPGVEDGEIVEAVSLTLQPFRFEGDADPWVLRSELARSVFLTNGGVVAPDVLPLALLFVQSGLVRWIDVHLVRREVTAGDTGALGIAETNRAQREAHYNQYDQELRELVIELSAQNQLRFPATRYFRCLPSVGRLPAAAIDPVTFTQAFFPPAMTIELSAVVEDELPRLLENALHLPPIDLVGGDEDFDHTRVHVLVPMPAARLDALRLASVTPPKLLLQPAVLAKRTPLLALKDWIAKRRPDPTDLVDEARPEPAPLLAAWRHALAGPTDRLLWFVRVPAVACASVELFDELDADEDGIPDTKEEADAKIGTDTKHATDAAAKNATDAKNTEDSKNAADAKNADDAAKSQQDAKAQADAKGQQDAKTEQDAKNATDTKRDEDGKRETDTKNARDTEEKNTVDGKAVRDNVKDETDAKRARDALKDALDAKRERDDKPTVDGKTIRDNKELVEGGIKLRDDPIFDPNPVIVDRPRVLVEPTPVTDLARTFIRPSERPDLDTRIVTKTRES